jgi:hypothetical protein
VYSRSTPAQRALVRPELESLRHTRRELAPLLDASQVLLCRAAPAKGREQHVGRRDRVLHSEVDADAAHRRHRVRGVADAKDAWCVPRSQPVDGDAQELQVVQRRKLIYTIRDERRELGDQRAEIIEASPLHFLKAALDDVERALPVVAEKSACFSMTTTSTPPRARR